MPHSPAVEAIRRHRAHIESIGGETDISRSAIIELAARVERLEAEVAALSDQWLKLRLRGPEDESSP